MLTVVGDGATTPPQPRSLLSGRSATLRAPHTAKMLVPRRGAASFNLYGTSVRKLGLEVQIVSPSTTVYDTLSQHFELTFKTGIFKDIYCLS